MGYVHSIAHRLFIVGAMALGLLTMASVQAQAADDGGPHPSKKCRGWDYCDPGDFLVGADEIFIEIPCYSAYLSVGIFSFEEKYHWDIKEDCGNVVFQGVLYTICSGSSHRRLDPCAKPGL